MTASDNSTPGAVVLQGLLPFDRARIGPDIIAGITLGALGIPEVMGYAKIIGTPVITGLYTMFLPVVVFALFGSPRAILLWPLTPRPQPCTPKYVALTSLIGLVGDCRDTSPCKNSSLGFPRRFRLSHRSRRFSVGSRRSGCLRATARDARDRKGWPRILPTAAVHFSGMCRTRICRAYPSP